MPRSLQLSTCYTYRFYTYKGKGRSPEMKTNSGYGISLLCSALCSLILSIVFLKRRNVKYIMEFCVKRVVLL